MAYNYTELSGIQQIHQINHFHFAKEIHSKKRRIYIVVVKFKIFDVISKSIK